LKQKPLKNKSTYLFFYFKGGLGGEVYKSSALKYRVGGIIFYLRIFYLTAGLIKNKFFIPFLDKFVGAIVPDLLCLKNWIYFKNNSLIKIWAIKSVSFEN